MAMFKRVLESLSKSLRGGKPAASKTMPPPARSAPPVKSAGVAKAPAQNKAPSSPEEMCGITPRMTNEQIGAQLKVLYRRYNRGASSLNATVREDADRMLDAIVAIREKTFGEL